MKPSRNHNLLNWAQSFLIIGGMALIAYIALAAIAGPWITLYIVGGGIIGMLGIAARSKDVVLKAYKAQPLDPHCPECAEMLTELTKRADLPARPNLYWAPSKVPNAFAIGKAEDSAICFSDGLMRMLTRREFAGVLAHEVSHIANRDLWIMGLADMMSRAVSMVSWLGMGMLFLNVPFSFSPDGGMVPFYVPLLLIFAPTLMSLLQLALSRTREYDADMGAVELTGDAEGLASALDKLERRVGAAWEEIVMPGRRIPQPSLLRTHPKTEDRIARLKAYAGTKTALPRPRETVFAPSRLPQIARAPKYRTLGFWY